MTSSRPLATLALAAALAALAPAAARAQSRSGADQPGLRLGALLGIDRGDWDGIGLRLDAELDLQRLSPAVMFAGVGSLAYSHLSVDQPDFSQSLDLFEIVPAARFLLAINRQAGFYGDLGLGLYWVGVHTTDFARGLHSDDSDVGLAARIGGGGYVWASDQVRIDAEIAFHPHTGNYDDTSFTAMVGVMFRTRTR
ncbi:outer membrane beta-barrel protein [Anaeromyxobacter oryzae]|uniref:Outer membrane protein beta-barrel domain-containing protein n=1 Tax=Anaeromyxobacter oryzae TaxID=2918170 RepID=A0ABM7WQW7_9BACT|nr:outer membrane beta-barrel protein [Anaeromyxobacter oryzae]BDG01844.1 hypothetical protein AMOR_08400 [Anaeromyxobacter oryzae]